MNELITIIIPIYKVEYYLGRCVDSVLAQTYKNMEIILVDDGSPDRCGELCDEYAKMDARIKVIHKKNGGLSDARNKGIDIAKGEYITFLDSDDWIHEKYIETLYKLLKDTHSDISVCNFIKTSNEDVQLSTAEEVFEYSKLQALEELLGRYYVQLTTAWGKLYKRSLFENIRFPVGRIHEDEFTTYKLIYNADKVALTTAELYYYWQREDSIMGVGFNQKGFMDALDAFEQRAMFYKKVGLDDLTRKTYWSLFVLYINTVNRIHTHKLEVDKAPFAEREEKVKQIMRTTDQSTSKKIFCELYFLMPRLMYQLYSKK